MPPIIFAIISYLGWGTGDIFGTIATRKIGGYSTTFWYLLIQLILSLALAPFFFSDLKHFTLSIFVINIVLGLVGTASLVTFYEGLRVGSASLVGTISASFVAVTVILSIIFLKETVTLNQAFAIIIIFCGIIVSSLNLKDFKKGNFLHDKGTIFAVATMVLWGIYWAFIKIPITEIGWYWPSIISLSTFPVILFFMKLRNLPLSKINQQNVLPSLFVNALLLSVGEFSFNYAISSGSVTIIAPIAGSYPTLFAALSFFIFKDPITKQQIAGIVITLIGIVLLSIFST